MDKATGIQGPKLHLRSMVLHGQEIDGVVEAQAHLMLGADGRAFGRGGCNRFFGSYSIEGSVIRFGPMASTLMYCEETMAVENAFLKALGEVDEIQVDQGIIMLRSIALSTELTFHPEIEAKPGEP
jgi:heat shock protein HslJ